MPEAGIAVEFRPGGRFRLTRQIGVGGMGTVYEAWDTARNTRVALKTLTGLNPLALQLFKNEFRTLAGISHPNLASLYELFCEDQWYFSMEYVEGCHFLEYVRGNRGPQAAPVAAPTLQPDGDELTLIPGITPRTAPAKRHDDTARLASALKQLAEAISSLHSAGILHRDLKPLNVKVTPEGRIVVLDFGLATQTNQSFGEGIAIPGFVGTVQYMSPEQASGDTVTGATDWYAIGVMVFEALTGRRPFEGDPGNILRDKRIFEAPRASRLAGVSEQWDNLCAGLLARNPNSRFSSVEILASLEQQPAPTGGVMVHRPEKIFVGRELHLAVLRGALSDCESGTPSFVLVRGLSGMGKSTLIEHFLGEVGSRRNLVILAGRCYEKESLPYKAFDSVVDSLAHYLFDLLPEEAAELTPRDAFALGQVFPVLRRIESFAKAPARNAPHGDQLELRRQAFGALRELLAKLGDRHRVVVCIDDLQWGDTDSVLLFQELLHPPDSPACLYIVSYRSEYEGRSPALDSMLAMVQDVAGISPHRLMIGPLSNDDSRMLAQRLASNRQPESPGLAASYEDLVRESEGSPYLLQELASGAAFASRIAANPTVVTLDAVLFRRIEALSVESRRLLESVSVSVRPLGEREAFLAARLSERDPRILTELRAGRLIRGVGDEIEPYHDRVRQTTLAHLGPNTLRECHFRLAHIIEATGQVDTEAAAVHFENGGEPSKAGHYYALAAQTASSALAFRHAAQLWQKALSLSTATGEPRRLMLINLADALGNAGRGADAGRAWREASHASAGAQAVQFERQEAYWFASSGHLDEGREALERMLGRVGFHMPGPLGQMAGIIVAELRLKFRGTSFRRVPPEHIPQPDLDRIDTLWAAARSIAMVDIPTSVFLNSRCLLLSLSAGDPYRVTRALNFRNIGLSAFSLPTGDQLPQLMAVSRTLTAEANDPYLNGFGELTDGMIDFVSGRWFDGQRHYVESARILAGNCTGVAWELATVRTFSLWCLLWLGHFRELSVAAPVLHKEGLERGDLFQAVSIGTGHMPICELVADRPDLAMAIVIQSLGMWTRRNYNLQMAVSVFSRTWIHLYRGEAADAHELNTREWPELGKTHFLRVSGTRQWLRFSRAQSALALAVSTTGREGLLRIAEQEARRLQADDKPFAAPLSALVRAGTAGIGGNRELAVVLLEQAAAEFQRLDMAMFSAITKRRIGELTAGEPGLALIRESEEFMRAEGVVNPSRMADAFAVSFAQFR